MMTRRRDRQCPQQNTASESKAAGPARGDYLRDLAEMNGDLDEQRDRLKVALGQWSQDPAGLENCQALGEALREYLEAESQFTHSVSYCFRVISRRQLAGA